MKRFRQWLRSRFAWRFSLIRLMAAVVFLGVFTGLNMRTIGPFVISYGEGLAEYPPRIYWGWPLPFSYELADPETVHAVHLNEADRATLSKYEADRKAGLSYRFPWTHQCYHLLDLPLVTSAPVLLVAAVFDLLFALTVLALILFLQIPRRKVAAKVE